MLPFVHRQSICKVFALPTTRHMQTPNYEEQSTWERLRAAYILRSSTIMMLPSLSIRYDLLPELTSFVVMTMETTRQWGNLQDIQALSRRVAVMFMEGIVLLDHATLDAWWIRGSDVVSVGVNEGLRMAITSNRLLMLARVGESTEDFVFAHVQAAVEYRPQIQSVQWLREFLACYAIHIDAAPSAFPARPTLSRSSDFDSQLEE